MAEVIKAAYVGRLSTVSDWAKEISRVYRQMRKGEIDTSDGTKLTYVANIGAQLVKMQEELKELTALREQVAAIQLGNVPTNGHAIDYLPAAVEGDES